MITSQQLKDIDLEHCASSPNGGSMVFRRKDKNCFLAIDFHGDNFLYKKYKDPRLNVITISLLHDKVLYEGEPKDIEDFKTILADCVEKTKNFTVEDARQLIRSKINKEKEKK